MPIDYKNYHPEWKSRIRPSILVRADYCCERCGVADRAIGYRLKNGLFMESTTAPQGSKLFKIVLTIAHVNHDVNDNNPDNLRAWCQRCHLKHDVKLHTTNRLKSRKS